MSSTASLLARALQTPAPQDADETQERILDAALELVAAAGMRHLTMDDVAARAGVGRMTVYRRFGTRQALTDALTLREAQRCLVEIAGAVRPGDPLEDRVAELFLATLRVIAEHPLLARLARHEPEALLRELTRNDSEVFEQVRGFLVAQIQAAQAAGEVAEGDPLPLAELAIRLGASFVLIPGGVFASDAERTVREAIRMALAPITG
jgi:AcrR family transcriptional regulator